jgi:hypothetical protein
MDEYSSESNNFNYKMDEYSSESFTRIYISSWMSILTIKDGQNQITLIIKWMSIRANPYK